ncbi:MAG: S46 family peptidase, partial [Bacteroidaceae bacterium]|nr:S46 family peptidase [Bacteroidaceae bacterium]
MKKILLSATLCALSLLSHADEGMWMLNRIDAKTAEAMKSLGLQLTPEQLYSTEHSSLKDCVVDFGDFCSGVVVSKDGLVFTNHHCGYGAIQSLSTPKDDILKNGFVARSRDKERPAEGLFVKFLQRTEDCTARIVQALSKVYEAHPDEPKAELDKQYTDSIMGAVEKELQGSNPGLECLVKAYYENNAFYASYYKVYRDVRLVFTATETLGKFGGDTDNWMWPRQTCDFSVFRIYADKDGQPAEYSEENVPLQVENYARISTEGYRNGDFCMTVGYPGSTSRYLSSWGIDERVNASNVSTIQVRGKKQEVWKRFMDNDRAVAIKYASKWASSSNYWKNSIGMNKAIANLGVIEQKQQLEDKIRDWYGNRRDLTDRFGQMFSTLKEAYTERRNDVYAMGVFRETFMRGIELYRVAHMLNTMPTDADSTEAEGVRTRMEAFFKDYDAKLDEATMAALLKNYREQVTDKKYWPECYNTIDSLYGGDEAAYAHDVFSKTICKDLSSVEKLLADSTLRETDPALLYAAGIPIKMQEIAGDSRNASTIIDYNEHLLTQALLEMDQEMPHYSDANFTMRLSYGYIQDYTAEGQHYQYYTNAKSLLDKAAKQKKIEDYKLEKDIVSLMKKGNWGRYADKTTGDMHLCFLSNNDITGGNSGSPMFNGRGELLGLAFDGNWEAMSGDISFDNNLQRCIGVDVRYMLFIIDKWGKADNLIKEL